MWSQKEIIIFLAGAQSFHTLTHIIINLTDMLPIKFCSINWTRQLNMAAIFINALITAGLFYWIYKL